MRVSVREWPTVDHAHIALYLVVTLDGAREYAMLADEERGEIVRYNRPPGLSEERVTGVVVVSLCDSAPEAARAAFARIRAAERADAPPPSAE